MSFISVSSAMASTADVPLDVSWIYEPTIENPNVNTSTAENVNSNMTYDISWMFQQPDTLPPPLPRKRTQKKKTTVLGCKRKPGRKAIEEKFPDVPPVLTDMLQLRGFQAPQSRANPTGQSGMSLSECRDGLLKNVPQLQDAHPNLGKSAVY